MYIELQRALLNLFSICLVSLCSLEVRGSQRGETGAVNLPSHAPTDSFALQSVSVHLEITNSASQMENKRDTLCFEEIDPRGWQAGCQPAWL